MTAVPRSGTWRASWHDPKVGVTFNTLSKAVLQDGLFCLSWSCRSSCRGRLILIGESAGLHIRPTVSLRDLRDLRNLRNLRNPPQYRTDLETLIHEVH